MLTQPSIVRCRPADDDGLNKLGRTETGNCHDTDDNESRCYFLKPLYHVNCDVESTRPPD